MAAVRFRLTDSVAEQNTIANTVGKNGVAIARPTARQQGATVGYRTYEVHQRERVGESTEKLKPTALISEAYRRDPYTLLQTLRENYPLYRNWAANAYWVTPYNEVTSVFADDANFESRTKLWSYGMPHFGRDFGQTLSVLEAEARCLETDAEAIAERLLDKFVDENGGDLAKDFAGAFALELLAECWGIPHPNRDEFYTLYWRAQRGVSWQPDLQQDGRQALDELTHFFTSLLADGVTDSSDGVLSALLSLQVDGGVTPQDLVATLLERDHETLHGALANLWFLLLTHPEEFTKARSERRLMKLGYLETLRHSAPVLSAERYTRHEVERFGKLLPEGSLVICSAAAANRDATIFADPDGFIVDRKDLCQREPRGQYRADGLASGIAFGLGKPSIHPAVPEDRPRSAYALTRDAVVTASMCVVEHLPQIALATDAEPYLTALTVGEMHTCWRLPVIC